MRILLIKMSSMGDIIHTFPALTEAKQAIPELEVDWVVENAFQELPHWHPAVNQVFTVALRTWRKHPWQTFRSAEFHQLRRALKVRRYDVVIDAQGLVKSALVSLFTKGTRHGFSKSSAREPLASWFYQQRHSVATDLHVSLRVRQLFAQALSFTINETHPVLDYGIKTFQNHPHDEDYLVFIPNTTWVTKHWPETYWQQLISLATAAGFRIKIPWGNALEKQRAERLAYQQPQVEVLPKLTLTEIAHMLQHSCGIVSVDTGFTHMAAALGVANVSLYGPTDPALTGAMGKNQRPLSAEFDCAPCLKRQCHFQAEAAVFPACFSSIQPHKVWQSLTSLLADKEMA